MCTMNENNMMYGSWDIRHDKQSFLSFWIISCPLIFLTTWKIKILKKWKKRLKILSFYTCISQMMIICVWFLRYGVPQTEFFVISYKKWNSYDVCFLRCEAQKTSFCLILDHFLPFYSLAMQKIKIFIKWKKCPYILSFCTSVP